MLRTEEEAGKTECQRAIGHDLREHMCGGIACMAWRWGQSTIERVTRTNAEAPPEGKEWRELTRGVSGAPIGFTAYERPRPPAERKGYCGEAGKPEFGE